MEHRFGGKIVCITAVAHETYKGVASWHFLGDVEWSDGTKSSNIQISPHQLCGKPEEVEGPLASLNDYLAQQGDWHDTKHKRDGRVYSWTPKKPKGERKVFYA